MTRVGIYGGAFFLVICAFGLAPLPSALLAIPIIPLAGLLFAAMGLCFTLQINSLDLYSFYFTLFLTPLFLFSGVFFPLEERLSGIWLTVAEVLPLLHPVRLCRDAFAGSFGPRAVWDLGYIVATTGALLLWSRAAMRRRLTS